MTNFSLRQAILPMLLVFASGAALGGFAVNLYKAKTVTASAVPRNPREWRERYVSDMKTRLQLNDTQVGKLNGVLDSTKSQYDAVKARYKPEMDEIHNLQVSNIRGMLAPTQATEYDKFRIERDRDRQKQPRKD